MTAGAVQQFPLAGGFDESIDPASMPIGTMRSLTNAAWTKDGRLDKRFGTATYSKAILGGGFISAGARLVLRGDELALIDGANLYAYSATAAAWVLIGQVPDVGLTTSTLLDAQAGIAGADVARSSNGYIVNAWITGDPTLNATGPLFMQVLDDTGRVVVLPPTQLTLSGNYNVRVVIIGTKAIILSTKGTNVVAYTIDLTTFAFTFGTNLRTDAASNSPLDACVIGSNFVILYETTTATMLYSYNTSLAQQATATVEAVGAGAGTSCCSLDGAAGESLYVAYRDPSSHVRVAVHTANTLAQTVAPFTVESLGAGDSGQIAIARYDASNAVLAYSTLGSGGSPRTTSYEITNTGTALANSLRGTWGVRLISRPFVFNGRAYFFGIDYPNVVFSGSTFPGINTCLFELPTSSNIGLPNYVPHRYVGKVEHLIGGMSAVGMYSNVAAVSATSVYVASLFQGVAPQKNTTWRQGVRLVNATCGASLPLDFWRSVSIGQETYIAGGLLAAYDGRTCFDYGFARAPMIGALTPGAGGNMAAGNYIYGFCEEYRSAAGMLHRSATSLGAANSVGASGTVAITLNGTNIGNKKSVATGFVGAALQTLIPLFRTTVGNSIPYRLTYEPSANVLTNNEQNQTQTITDNRADANIDGANTPLNTRPILYTTSGELDDQQPPGFLTVRKYRERLVGIGVDKRTLWFSKSYISNPGVAPGFHASLIVSFTEDLIGLEVMDDKLVVFSKTGIWLVVGAGPDSSGQNAEADFTSPVRVQTDVGCVNPRSIVATNDGIFFQSIRGLYALTRGLELVWMGKRAQDTLAAYPNITSACLVAGRNQVRWTANTLNGVSGIALVFDYVRKQWAVFKYYDTVSAIANTPIADAAVLSDGTWCFITPTGSIYKEDASTYLDGGTTWVSAGGELASVSSGGALGFQRMRRSYLRGDRYTDCDLTLAFDFDDKETFPQSHTWHSDELAALDTAIVGMRCGTKNGANPRCRSFGVKFFDAAPTGPGASLGNGRGCTFSVVGFEIVPKPGLTRRGARARA